MSTDNWKEYTGTSCPDCGWLMACAKCSKRYDLVDEDIDQRKEEAKKRK